MVLDYRQQLMKRQTGLVAKGSLGTLSQVEIGGTTTAGIPIKRYAMGCIVSSDVANNSLLLLNGTEFMIECRANVEAGLHTIYFPSWPSSSEGTSLKAAYSGGPGGTCSINLFYY